MHPDDYKVALEGLHLALTQEISTVEYRIRHNDGHYRWIEDNKRLVRDVSDNSTEIVGVWIDISDRKRSEQQLHESEEQFSLIAENVTDLIAVLDLKGKRLYNSPSYKKPPWEIRNSSKEKTAR